MQFTPENAAGQAQQLSDAFGLPVRIYLSAWSRPAACETSRQLCRNFACDGELLALARAREGDCVILCAAGYGEGSVLLCAGTPRGRQFAVLGPAALSGAPVPPEAFPAWDAAGFGQVHSRLPVRSLRQLEAVAALAARAMGMAGAPVVRRGVPDGPDAPAPRAARARALPAALPQVARSPEEYRRQAVRFVQEGDWAGMVRLQVLYADLDSAAPVGEGALRVRKNDFISFLELLGDAAMRGGVPFDEVMELRDAYMRQAEQLPAFGGLMALYLRAAYNLVRCVALRKGLPWPAGPVGGALDALFAAGAPCAAGDIARRLGVSVPRLNRLFKEELAISFTDLSTLCRLQQARSLLCTEMPIAGVARAAGFPSVNSMDGAFRKFLGLSPLAYRRIKIGRG